MIIKVLYDNGQNGLVKLSKAASKDKKRLSEMSAEEMSKIGCEIFG